MKGLVVKRLTIDRVILALMFPVLLVTSLITAGVNYSGYIMMGPSTPQVCRR